MSLAFLHERDCSQAHTDAIWGISWTATDNVISISADGSIKEWSSETGDMIQPTTFPPPHPLALVSLSVSPDGRYVLYNSLEGTTALWDLHSRNVVGKFESFSRQEADTEPAWSVSISPDGQTYASSGGSGNLTLHSAGADNFGSRLSTIPSGRQKFGMNCAFSNDGKRVALSSETGQIFIFDVQENSLVTTWTSHAMAARSLSWSYDSSVLLSGSEDKRLVLHDVRANGGSFATFTGHSSWVTSCSLSADGRYALSGSTDKTVKVWDIGTRAAVSTVQENSDVWAVSWRPKPANTGAGKFVTGGDEGLVRWWRSGGS